MIFHQYQYAQLLLSTQVLLHPTFQATHHSTAVCHINPFSIVAIVDLDEYATHYIVSTMPKARSGFPDTGHLPKKPRGFGPGEHGDDVAGGEDTAVPSTSSSGEIIDPGGNDDVEMDLGGINTGDDDPFGGGSVGDDSFDDDEAPEPEDDAWETESDEGQLKSNFYLHLRFSFILLGFVDTNGRLTDIVDLENVGDEGATIELVDRTVQPSLFDIVGAADYNEGSNEAPQPEQFDQDDVDLGEELAQPQVPTVLPIEIPVYEVAGVDKAPDISMLIEMKQNRSVETPVIEKFFAAFADLQGLSRDDWVTLREGLQLIRDKDGNTIKELAGLPKQLSTLIDRHRKRLPLINMREADIPLKAEKMPTEAKNRRRELVERLKARARGEKPKRRKGKRKLEEENEQEPISSVRLTYFDPPSMIKNLVSSDIMHDIHQGPGVFVDFPKELYESRAWTSSNRASAGQYPHLPLSEGAVVLAGDDIYYRCVDPSCYCHEIDDDSDNVVDLHIGRVLGFGWDMRTSSCTGQSKEILALQIQLYINAGSPQLEGIDFKPPMEEDELILYTDSEPVYIPETNAFAHIPIYKDYAFGECHENPSLPKSRKKIEELPKYHQFGGPIRVEDQQDMVRRVIVKKRDPSHGITKEIISLCHTHPIRGELEVEYYGRNTFEFQWDQKAVSMRVISLPVETFIDGFGVFSNSYRSLMGYYITPCGLSARDRLRPGNIIPLVLGPHGSDFSDVIKGLGTLADLDGGVKMVIHGEEVLVSAWTMVFIGDMPQQVSFPESIPHCQPRR